MINDAFVDTGHLTPEGTISIPSEILKIVGLTGGGEVKIVADDGEIRIMNPAIHALKVFQAEMAGEAEKAGLYSDDDVVKFVKDIRRESNG